MNEKPILFNGEMVMKNVMKNLKHWLSDGGYIYGYDNDGEAMRDLTSGDKVLIYGGSVVAFAVFVALVCVGVIL